jgi:hypothetical protein
MIREVVHTDSTEKREKAHAETEWLCTVSEQQNYDSFTGRVDTYVI